MTIHELESNDWKTSRKIILKNRKEIQKNLEKYLNGIIENLNELTDYDIYEIIKLCEFTISQISISQLWEPKK